MNKNFMASIPWGATLKAVNLHVCFSHTFLYKMVVVVVDETEDSSPGTLRYT